MLKNDTKKILSEGEQLQEFVKSDGWKIARKRLTDKLIVLDSFSAIPKEGRTDAAILKEARLREAVNSVIVEWLKEIEGLADQANFNTAEFLEKERKDSIIQVIE